MEPTTTENAWIEALSGLPTWFPPSRRTVVISPHPDDESLGAGCLVAHQSQLKIPIQIVAATDGEAAYAGVTGLAPIRRAEQEAALAELGVDAQAILRLGLPDSGLAQCEEELARRITPLVDSTTLLVAPWKFDPHPDHEICGRVAEHLAARTGAQLVSYFFWTWHRNSVDSLAGLPMRRFFAVLEHQSARERALGHYHSQRTEDYGPAILPDALLAPARRPFETFLIHSQQ